MSTSLVAQSSHTASQAIPPPMASITQPETAQAASPPVIGELTSRLDALRRRLRWLALVRGLGISVLAFAGGIAVGGVLDFFWQSPLAVRVAMPTITIGLTLGLVVWFVVRPLLRHYADLDLAAVIEAAHPELGERLSSLVELSDPNLPQSWRGSALMCERLREEAVTVGSTIEFRSAVSSISSVRCGLAGMSAVVLILLPLLIAPAGYRLLLTRFFTPWSNLERVGDLYFEIPGGDRVVPRERGLTIKAFLKSHSDDDNLPAQVQFEWTTKSGRADTRQLEFDKVARAFVITLPRVREDFEFAFTVGNARSRNYQVTVVDPPALAAFTLHIQPPEYTKRPSRSIDGVIGEIAVFERSLLRMELQFESAVARAELLRGNRAYLSAAFTPVEKPTADLAHTEFQLADDGRSAILEFTAEQGGAFAILLTDKNGLHNRDAPERSLRIIRDRPPEIIKESADEPAMLAPNEPLIVRAAVLDDIAIGRFQLECRFVSGETRMVEAEPELLGVREVDYTFRLELSSTEHQSGTVFTYRLRAADTRPVPGPQWVSTQPRDVTIHEVTETAEERTLAREQQRLLTELDEIHEGVRRQRQRVKQHAAKPKNDQNQLREMAQEQTELAQRLEQLSEKLGERPVLSSLTSPARGIAEQQLEASAEETQQAASTKPEQEKESLNASAEKLGEADEKMADLRRRFEQLAALERDLLDLERLAERARELSEQVGELQRRQEKLAAQPDSPNKKTQQKQIAAQQQQAEQEAAALAEQLRNMLEQHPEILEAARRAQLEKLKQLGRVARAISQSQEQLAATITEDDSQGNEEETSQSQPQPDDIKQEIVSIVTAQRKLAHDAVAFARQIARTLGPQSATAKRAMALAIQAAAAAERAILGQLPESARAAQQAAEIAAQLTDDSGKQDLIEQAEKLKVRQTDLTRQFTEMTKHPGHRIIAQQFGQQNLSAQTQQLDKHFAEVARALKAKPLDLQKPGEQAEAAGQQTSSARELMQQATTALKQNSYNDAVKHGEQAAAILRLVADQISKTTADNPAEQGELPSDAASDITQAMEQMQKAQQQLSEEQNSPEKKQSKNQQPGQQGPSQALQKAADSLSQATQKLQPGQGSRERNRQQGQKSQQTGQAGAPGQSAGGGSDSPAAEMEAMRADFEKLSGRRWGELSSKLRTEILEAAARRPGGDYAPLIKQYFRELARTKRRGRTNPKHIPKTK